MNSETTEPANETAMTDLAAAVAAHIRPGRPRVIRERDADDLMREESYRYASHQQQGENR